MGLLSNIWDGVKGFFSAVGRFFKRLWRAFIDFIGDVINWFKNLRLRKDRDIPFVLDGKKLKEQLQNAPVYETGEILFSSDAPIVKGVLDSETDELIAQEVLEAGSLDSKTRDMMNHADRGIVVLG